MKKTILGLLLICMVVTGCRDGQLVKSILETQSESTLTRERIGTIANEFVDHYVKVEDLKKKYGTESEENIMPLYNVSSGSSFIFQFNCDLNILKGSSDEFHSRYEVADKVVTIHTDREAGPNSVLVTYNQLPYEDDGVKSQLTVNPLGIGDEFFNMSPEEYSAADKGAWGNAPIYYIRVNYDLNATTPTKLDKPLIIPFTVKSDLSAPNLRYEIDKEGRFKLVWDKVEGAETYRIYNASYNEENDPTLSRKEVYRGVPADLIGSTSDTEFNDFAQDGEAGMFAGDGWVIRQNNRVNGDYYVTAVNADMESIYSNVVQTSGLSKLLPVEVLDNSTIKSYSSIDELPKSVPVTFIDGSVANLGVSYEGTLNGAASATEVYLAYMVSGTSIKDYVIVDKITADEMELLQSDNFQAPELNAGNIIPQNSFRYLPDSDVPTIIEDETTGGSFDIIERQIENTRIKVAKADKESVPVLGVVNDVQVNADSALEEFLALNLTAAQEAISLRAFPEAQNTEVLYDVLQKVIYQNPLILGVDNYGYDYNSITLFIKYDDSQELINQKQQQMVQEAQSIVRKVITDGMNDEQKALTLYDYLNDYTKYDQSALDNAVVNNYMSVDAKFNDSFSTYGVLVNKLGVCGSYAKTYKLLSDLAEVDNLVVSGTLEHVPHAWNKIQINNKWVNVDTTNNETNSGVPYFLYGSSDKIAEDLNYSENSTYWLDEELSQFAAKDNSQDYYVTHGLDIQGKAAYKSKLSEMLVKGDSLISLRVSGLNSDELMNETSQVYDDVAPDKKDFAELFELGNYVIIQNE
ncbi:transglutaminase domain-containing protein [Paenibacillus segetis]|uniref:Transglutaminase-like domain-containing protein n=1 Tax=Paenibacillus segetis TaxID=1325360 RepID=A0ABQ1YIQ9_9BACL|nr:transglutaminase domain-containing protein [Paenibacillus segetis]GGH27415.1 hypothetical protein GCM10008013_28850 [Paenibacillus segetis]